MRCLMSSHVAETERRQSPSRSGAIGRTQELSRDTNRLATNRLWRLALSILRRAMYLERAVPGVIFCGYLFLLVQRALLHRTPPQHPVCYLLLLAWCGLAVAAASRRWPWAIRLALQVAWFGHYAVTNYWVWNEY